jgi:hypothetical protein
MYLSTLPLHLPNLLNYYYKTHLWIPCTAVTHQKLLLLQLVKKFPCVLRNPKDHFHIHDSPQFFPILKLTRPVVALPSHFFKTHYNISHPHLGLTNFLYYFRFQHHNHIYFSLLSHSCRMPRPSFHFWFDYPNIIWCVVFYIYYILGWGKCGSCIRVTTLPPTRPEGDADNLTNFVCRLSRNSGSLNLLDPTRFV